MFRLLAAGSFIALTLVPAAIPASARPTASVVISVSTRGVLPKTAHARVQQAVIWTNATGSRHRIRPSRGGFGAFVLAAHGRHTVHFGAAGRYPYRVDGRTTAVVLVRRAGTGTMPGGKRTILKNWSGTFHSDAASNGGAGYQPCSTSWSGTIHFTVSSRGVAGGTGSADEVAGTAQCSLYLDPTRLTGADFTVHGAVTLTDVSLTFTLIALRGGPGGDGSGFVTHLGYEPTIDLPIDAHGRVRGSEKFTYPFGNGGTITADDRLDLTGSS